MESRRMLRRSVLPALLTLALGSAAAAQESGPQESAIGTRLDDYRGYVELTNRFGSLMGEFGAFAGAQAAVRLKRRLYVGLGGLGLATDNARVPGAAPGSSLTLGMGYGGLLVGYVSPAASLVDVTAEVLVGGGGVSLSGLDRTDEVFVFEPSMGVELRLAPIVRLGLGAGYRFVGGADLPGVRDSDLRGFTGTAAVRIGWF
jgi:hypothetical protein